MEKRQLYKFIVLTLFSVFFVATVWKFWLEDKTELSFFHFKDHESLEIKLEFIITAVLFSALAMIYPSSMLLKHSKEKHEAERKLMQYQKNLESLKEEA